MTGVQTCALPISAGDIFNRNPVELGNVQVLENIIKIAFLQQSVSFEQLPLINLIANGFIGYWSGATLSKLNTPLIPAPGAIANTNINSNIVAINIACFNVRAPDPTEVPNAFATSFDPVPHPNNQAANEPTITNH